MFPNSSADCISPFSRPREADDLQSARGAIGRELTLDAFAGSFRCWYENNGISAGLQNPIKLLSEALMLAQPNNPHRPFPLMDDGVS